MPQTAEATKTDLENESENPKNSATRKVVHVSLIFDGVEFDPQVLYEVLSVAEESDEEEKAKGLAKSYAVVRNEKDSAGRGNYVFRISA